MNQEMRNCQSCKKDFVIETWDFSFYEKMKVPPPTWCPKCRLQRRFATRNERTLYKRNCDLCNTSIITMFSPGNFKVYCSSCYYSDKWDPLNYGRDYDFSKTFFAQWASLQNDVPQLALMQENVVNSPWVN